MALFAAVSTLHNAKKQFPWHHDAPLITLCPKSDPDALFHLLLTVYRCTGAMWFTKSASATSGFFSLYHKVRHGYDVMLWRGKNGWEKVDRKYSNLHDYVSERSVASAPSSSSPQCPEMLCQCRSTSCWSMPTVTQFHGVMEMIWLSISLVRQHYFAYQTNPTASRERSCCI